MRETALLLGMYLDVAQTTLRIPDPGCVVTFMFRLSYVILSMWEMLVVQGQADGERAGAGTVVSVSVRWTCSELDAVVDHLALGANVRKGCIQDSVCSFFHGTYDTAKEKQAMEETRTE